MGEKVKTLYVLGAFDMEMEYIKWVLMNASVEIIQASSGYDVVSTETAHSCSVDNILRVAKRSSIKRIVFIECAPKAEIKVDGIDVVIIDEQVGCSISDSWSVSSISKLIDLLFSNAMDADTLMMNLFKAGYDIHDAEIIAAADFDLIQAYQGLIPFVTSDDVLGLRVRFMSSCTDFDQKEIMTRIDAAEQIIRSASKIDLCGTEVADLRGLEAFPGLTEASALIATPCLYAVHSGDQNKVMFGSASREMIHSFKNTLAPELGIRDVVEDPMSYQAYGIM